VVNAIHLGFGVDERTLVIIDDVLYSGPHGSARRSSTMAVRRVCGRECCRVVASWPRSTLAACRQPAQALKLDRRRRVLARTLV
jgi:hypothetical protein